MLTKIIATAIVAIIASSVIKQYRQDISLLINICAGLLIVLMCLQDFSTIIDGIVNLSNISSISNGLVVPLIKVLGIGYITEFCADIADDAGNKTISSKLLLGGKIAICLVALPIISSLVKAILSLI